MRTVYKYPLEWPMASDEFTMSFPEGAELLHFDMQGRAPTIWALVDPDKPVARRTFRLAGTGHPIEAEEMAHVGTCMDGPFVWHLFELVEA